MTPEEHSQAIEAAFMVFLNSIVEAKLTGPERQALYKDVALVKSESESKGLIRSGTMLEAAEVLLERIGGAQNLRPYVDSLMAGTERAFRPVSRS